MPSPYRSWGNHHRFDQKAMELEPENIRLPDGDIPILGYGRGRSYGDCCLNEGGLLLDTKKMNHIVALDTEAGTIRCQAGTSFAQVIEKVMDRGFFLPVVPSTKYITVGGATANDVHGRDHKFTGTFGRHIKEFTLLRSSGETLTCTPQNHTDLFNATIAGLGLTGLILEVEFGLKKLPSPWIACRSLPTYTFDEAISQLREHDGHQYSTVWLDLINGKEDNLPGVLVAGDHQEMSHREKPTASRMSVPWEAPEFLLNDFSLGMFNRLYHKMHSKPKNFIAYFEDFFYQLDKLQNWNRLYGKQGIIQYHFVIENGREEGVKEILKRIRKSEIYPYFAIAKYFGSPTSPGLMSFPKPGLMVALDFAAKKQPTPLLQSLDPIVAELGGRVYPAKDSHMTPESFRRFYPKWQEFSEHIDSRFSSNLWRRVN